MMLPMRFTTRCPIQPVIKVQSIASASAKRTAQTVKPSSPLWIWSYRKTSQNRMAIKNAAKCRAAFLT